MLIFLLFSFVLSFLDEMVSVPVLLYLFIFYSYIIHFRNLIFFVLFHLVGFGYRATGIVEEEGLFFRGVVFVFLFCFVLAGVLLIVLRTMLR